MRERKSAVEGVSSVSMKGWMSRASTTPSAFMSRTPVFIRTISTSMKSLKLFQFSVNWWILTVTSIPIFVGQPAS